MSPQLVFFRYMNLPIIKTQQPQKRALYCYTTSTELCSCYKVCSLLLNGAKVYLKSHLNCSNFRAKYWPGFQFNPELDSRLQNRIMQKKIVKCKCMSECMRRDYYALFDSHPQHECSISSCTKQVIKFKPYSTSILNT